MTPNRRRDVDRWYEHWLRRAATAERDGNLTAAIEHLNKAETKTGDPDELLYLRLWRDRLKKAAAKALVEENPPAEKPAKK